jgi:hypothetical protein
MVARAWGGEGVRTPFESESLGNDDVEEDEDEEEGEITPSHQSPLKTSLLFVTFSASRRGCPLVCTGGNATGPELGIIRPTSTVWSCAGILCRIGNECLP